MHTLTIPLPSFPTFPSFTIPNPLRGLRKWKRNKVLLRNAQQDIQYLEDMLARKTSIEVRVQHMLSERGYITALDYANCVSNFNTEVKDDI